MSNKSTVQFVINVTGNAQQAINAISQTAVTATSKVNNFSETMAKIRDAGLAVQAVSGAFGRLSSVISGCVEANNQEQEASAKLAKVMRNTMGATDDQIARIKELASAQQALGVIGDETQVAGAQELGTYLSKAESLERLMPIMNDMLAQQYGLNATQEQAVNIGSLLGKVMDGQVNALSRYGYKFDEAQEKILKYGTEEERVATLAEVIGQSVGGMNEALAETPEGRIRQTANSAGDLQERIGALVTEVKARLVPVVDGAISLANKAIDYFERHRVMLGALAAAIAAVVLAVKGWVIVQGILNVVMAMNPIVLIIAAIIALIAAIVWVISCTEGWSETWHNTMEYLKLTFSQLGSWLRLKWLEISDFLLSGFEVIEKGWRRLQSLWDKNSAADGLERIRESRDRRAAEIASAKDKVGELAEERRGIEVWQVKWKGKEKTSAPKISDLLKPSSMQTIMESVNSTSGNGNGSGDLGGQLGKSTSAIATGGTRSTEINITLGNMIESVVFNGFFEENRDDLERKLAESMYRILGMAEASAG